ncbi:NUDIX hydrolase [Ferrimicrobium acidiphilum]|jgi:ADP-ribose pyrophosphatase|uniref:NUDIX hydrolase n=1 Tax=Ferrimicrobium acidiphilum TaxID=121039 RepID=UPI0023F1621F|nr:NUDIX hydrolase [Ferrimicrobium acidiphilum]
MTFAKIGERTLATNGFLTMREKSFRVNGVDYRRTVVEHPGAVVIVPLLTNGRVVVVRQFRPSVERHLIELPAGKCDVPGEELLTTAERELQEECGLKADRLELVGSFLNSPGFTNETTHVVIALGLSDAPLAPQSVEEEDMQIRALSIGALGEFSALQELDDGKSIVGITLSKLYLLQHGLDPSNYPESASVRERFS